MVGEVILNIVVGLPHLEQQDPSVTTRRAAGTGKAAPDPENPGHAGNVFISRPRPVQARSDLPKAPGAVVQGRPTIDLPYTTAPG